MDQDKTCMTTSAPGSPQPGPAQGGSAALVAPIPLAPADPCHQLSSPRDLATRPTPRSDPTTQSTQDIWGLHWSQNREPVLIFLPFLTDAEELELLKECSKNPHGK